MKSDIQITTDVYAVLKNSALETAISGKLSKYHRPHGSDKEDIVINITENKNGIIQEADVKVDIYIPDIVDVPTEGYILNETRAGQLSDLAIQLLDVCNGDEFRFSLQSQNIIKVDGKDEHYISNKLLYRHVK